ncbi:MAG TPA: gamma-glutamyl-gamma-aminobutyrate hydrolase family protein [Nocardioidaceae bacterium]|nr:gamma-glutamyl-gamma-aminobutyrate hydrolase family protein [Nocardioidaceae bacterium]
MNKPVIGITSYVEPASWGAWSGVPAALVPNAYVEHVRRAGGLPVVLPPLDDEASEDDARRLLSRLDGLVLAGGADVESSRYDEPPHETAQEPRRDRDAAELALAQAARDTLPTLGVCRGMQIMVVAAGGTLEQHLPDRLDSLAHSPGPGQYGPRVVEPVDGTLLRSILGDRLEVNCYHHQGVAAFPTFDIAAVSQDGVVEAVEAHGPSFYLGVQWHPETGSDGRLFEALVGAAQ